MTKAAAIKIAKNLVEAVEAGLISETQARSRFKKVVAQYRRQEQYKNLQDVNQYLWMAMGRLMGA